MHIRRMEMRLFRRRLERFLRTRRGLCAVLSVLSVLLIIVFYYFHRMGVTSTPSEEEFQKVALFNPPNIIKIQRKGPVPLCRAPYNLNSLTSNLSNWLPVTPVTQCPCDSFEGLLFINNNYLQVNQSHPLKHSLTECRLQAVELLNDFSVAHSKEKTISGRDLLKTIFIAKHDFITATCKIKLENKIHEKIFHLVQTLPKPHIHKRINSQQNSHRKFHRPDVLILHLGKVGYQDVELQLPKTSRLLKKLEALRFVGYNSLGDCFRDNMIPMLSGMSRDHFFESAEKVYKNKNDPKGPKFSLDDHNLIWYEYERLGYSTLFAEDTTREVSSLFNKEGYGFSEPPTDHYMRPFWLTASPDTCLGCRFRHTYALEYLKDFFTDYANVSKFALYLHHEEIDGNLATAHLDSDVAEFITFSLKRKFSHNLVILVLGEPVTVSSENTFSKNTFFTRSLGFASIVLPRWFKTQYKVAAKSIIHNAGRTTTAYDLNLLLQDIIKVADKSFAEELPETNKHEKTQHHSPLRVYPIQRSCHSSGVPVTWCTCLRLDNISSNIQADTQVAGAKLQILNYFKYISARGCRSVKTIHILYADVFLPKTEKNVRRIAGPKLIREDTEWVKVYYLHIIFKTEKGETFLAVVEFDSRSNSYREYPDFRRLDNTEEDQSCHGDKKLTEMQKKICLC